MVLGQRRVFRRGRVCLKGKQLQSVSLTCLLREGLVLHSVPGREASGVSVVYVHDAFTAMSYVVYGTEKHVASGCGTRGDVPGAGWAWWTSCVWCVRKRCEHVCMDE